MEQQFKKLLQKTKAQKEQKDPLFKTFEGALFQDSSWFFHFQDQVIPVVPNAQSAAINTKVIEDIKSEIKPRPIASPVLSDNYLTEVLFVGDTFSGVGDDLLGKMITAMKLSGSEFFRFSMEEELENIVELAKNLETPDRATQNLLDTIKQKKPKIVVSLGATVTNILLGKREKLSTIHGQFFEKNADGCSYSLMPLFHPDFLNINPNMKRTAWMDLQKVMERIGKI